MRLNIVSIVLDGMPFIAQHLPVFNRLVIPWHWYIVEGAAMNTHCTSWCKPQQPRLSRDGTTEYLATLRGHPRITVIQKQQWDGKVEMFNTAVLQFPLEECVLLEVDVDEFWSDAQLELIHHEFETNRNLARIQFACNYYVGQNIEITTLDNYGNRQTEWMRVWRWHPGGRFKSHEPPELDCLSGWTMPRQDAVCKGLVFEHHAYVLPAQVRFKEEYYGYAHALENWQRLQSNKTWPVTDLRKFLPWVDPGVEANRIWK